MSKLKDAVVELCAFKDVLDQHISIRNAVALNDVQLEVVPVVTGRILRLPRVAIEPRYFLQMALPFSNPSFSPRAIQPDKLSPRCVISGTYGRYGLHDPGLVMDNSDELVVANRFEDPQAPKMIKIGSMPLFVAYEGKNRIELFKKFRPSMRAFVSSSAFPTPEKLKLVKFSMTAHWGVEFNGEVRVLPYPEPIVRLLRAYGVAAEKVILDLKVGGRVRRMRNDILARKMNG